MKQTYVMINFGVNNMKRLSEMSKAELIAMVKHLRNEEEQAVQDGWESQAQMLRTKRQLAESYLIDPQTIQTGIPYHIQGIQQVFIVSYLNGIMAWGTFEGSSEEVAYPLSVLQSIQSSCGCKNNHHSH